jgi:hypothetical protein
MAFVMLNAMEEAREENRKHNERMNKLSKIVDDVEVMTEDDEISHAELKRLKAKVAQMEKLLNQSK